MIVRKFLDSWINPFSDNFTGPAWWEHFLKVLIGGVVLIIVLFWIHGLSGEILGVIF